MVRSAGVEILLCIASPWLLFSIVGIFFGGFDCALDNEADVAHGLLTKGKPKPVSQGA